MSGKVAVVTAGGSGMGAAVARRLAADGLKVAVLSSSGKGEALAAELGGFGITGSNQSNDDLKRLVDGAMARWGRIEALVNSAMFPTSAVFRAGLAAYTKIFCDTFAADNVRMNNVLPGWIDSLPATEERRRSVPRRKHFGKTSRSPNPGTFVS